MKTDAGPKMRRAQRLTVTALVALVVAACGSVAATSPPPTPTFHATPAPPRAPTPSPTAPLTEAEASLLASMTARYDDCRQNMRPSGMRLANIWCTTVDGVRVYGTQYATVAAVNDAFITQAAAETGTRCSAGAYLGDYKVRGKATGQLGCSGTAGTLAWTVPELRLYLSAADLSMPELYAWWKYHWTVGSVASGATTGEKAVPIPVAAADTPEPVDSVDQTQAPAEVTTAPLLPSDALSQMEIAFVGTPRKAVIKGKLDAALALYRLEPTEENYSRAGSTLVALRIGAQERSCDACTEIAILDQMLRDGALPGLDFPDHAAFAATILELE